MPSYIALTYTADVDWSHPDHKGDTLLVSGRLKRGDDVIEVVAAQIDDAGGTPIHPINRPALTRPAGPGPSWPLEASSK